MIRLTFIPPDADADWQEWLDRGSAEVARMLQSDAKRKIDEELYKRQRQRLLEATHGKCAYCELLLAPGQRSGDVEHYRPKGKVRGRDGKVVKILRPDGTEEPHPGYFWLAYDYRNLLPACAACNRRAADRASGGLTGKADIFPTLDERWATCPEEVATELPALLNPWLPEDDPSEHLYFDPNTGTVGGLTERGKITVDVLGLNRDGLPEERKKAAKLVRKALAAVAHDDTNAHEAVADEMQILAAVKAGSWPYAAICRVAIRQAVQRLMDRVAPYSPGDDHRDG